jgi:zinc transport system ATP-binding protein
MNDFPLIDASNISVAFNGRHVLHDVSLRVEPGQIISLIGPNGAGKTTLVRVILGLQKPDSGRVERRPELSISYLPQRLNLDATLPITVERFLELSTEKRDKPVAAALEEAGVGALRKAAMQSISGGEFQRVMLARCLLRNPQLLVLDEPDQGMDTAGQQALFDQISDIRSRYRCGVLMVSHDLHLVMAATDQVVCLQQHICCTGHPQSITRHPEFLRLFGQPAEGLALYAHDHDHAHDLHGDVVND